MSAAIPPVADHLTRSDVFAIRQAITDYCERLRANLTTAERMLVDPGYSQQTDEERAEIAKQRDSARGMLEHYAEIEAKTARLLDRAQTANKRGRYRALAYRPLF